MEEETLSYPVYAISELRMKTDGEGVTTLITSFGCPLDCKWCINEGTKRVTGGKRLTVEELYEKVKAHNLYYLATGGGLTFGGGEPLLQSKFIEAFCRKYQNGWKYNMETSLSVPWDNVERLVPYIDFFIVDCKSMNATTYQAYTGKTQKLMLENLQRLLDSVGSKRIKVRVPLIPYYNNEKEQKESKKILKNMGFEQIECFSYKIQSFHKKNMAKESEIE